MTDEAFWAWAVSLKPCRYCLRKFVGPCCPWCECSHKRHSLEAK